MKAKDFVNRDDYIRIANLGHMDYFKHYVEERFKKPAKPPKMMGVAAFENDMPVLYIRKDVYPDYERWLTDEKKEELREAAERKLTLAREELDEEYEESIDEIKNSLFNEEDLGWKDA